MNKYLFFFLGFSATTSLLAVPIFGRYITIFNLLFILAFIYLLIEKRQAIKLNSLDNKFLSWMFISIFSSLFGFFYFFYVPTFQSAAINIIPKILLYTFLFLLIKRSNKGKEYCISICKGLLFGCVFNLVWAIVDAVVFYVLRVSITNSLFAPYLIAADIRYHQASLILEGTIRASGINSDPANLGLFAPIVALYALNKKSVILYLIALLSILASISHTAFFGIIAVTVIYLITNSNKTKTLVSFAAVSILTIILFSHIKNEVTMQMVDAFVERTEAKADGGELNGNRGEYWINFIPAVIHQPSALLIGTGYNTASYAYLKHNLVHHDFEAYDPEQTYFATFFDIGLIGLLLFVSLLFGLYKKYKIFSSNKDNCPVFIYSGIVASAISLCGYHYTLYSVVMLIIISGIILYNNFDVEQNLTLIHHG